MFTGDNVDNKITKTSLKIYKITLVVLFTKKYPLDMGTHYTSRVFILKERIKVQVYNQITVL